MAGKKEDNKEHLDNLRHSCAHLLAAAVTSLWSKAKPTIGPAIENGFYYDFDFGHTKISEGDLPKIEREMHKIVQSWNNFKRQEVSAKKAKQEFKNNPYKLELIDEFAKEGKELTLHKSGNFVDLCRGRHVENPKKELKHFKLLSIAGAYWRGDEKNKMLTRIYGTCWPSKRQLDDYLHRLKQAKMRDHRKLGKELGLYIVSDLVGPGLALYTPKAGVIVHEIEEFMRGLQTDMGYGHVYTPHLAKEDLFKTSGHLQWFAESMYPPMKFKGEGKYYAKPMNCPFHILLYNAESRSYKDLPIRYAEFGTVYRYEKSGEITGLLRTRGFTQDDAHIFCRSGQVVDEFLNVLNFVEKLLGGLGLKKHWHRLSLRDEGGNKKKYAGNDKQWKEATNFIRDALKKKGVSYKEVIGEATFYGPKLDVMFEDSLDRDWQISTIQVDFLQPQRFNLEYINEKGQKERPYMIHRAPLGSRERILAILIEHFAGAFPVWLSPTQVKVLPLTERNLKSANLITEKLKKEKIRTELDDRNETLEAKIRDAHLEKVPYMLIVGDKEEKAKMVRERGRSGKDYGLIKIDEFITNIKKEIENKVID